MPVFPILFPILHGIYTVNEVLTVCLMFVGAGILQFNFNIPWRRGDPVFLQLKKYNQRYSGKYFLNVMFYFSMEVVNYQI